MALLIIFVYTCPVKVLLKNMENVIFPDAVCREVLQPPAVSNAINGMYKKTGLELIVPLIGIRLLETSDIYAVGGWQIYNEESRNVFVRPPTPLNVTNVIVVFAGVNYRESSLFYMTP